MCCGRLTNEAKPPQSMSAPESSGPARPSGSPNSPRWRRLNVRMGVLNGVLGPTHDAVVQVLMRQTSRLCVKCGVHKALCGFGLTIYGTVRSECLDCSRARIRDYHHKHVARLNVAKREYLRTRPRDATRLNLKWKYGMTKDDFAELLAEQGGRCAICGTVSNADGSRLVVDHSHHTGYIRGLLCRTCNWGIGCLRDNPSFMDAAKAYLQKPGRIYG